MEVSENFKEMAEIYENEFAAYGLELAQLVQLGKLRNDVKLRKFRLWALNRFGNFEDAAVFLRMFVRIPPR